MMLVEQQALDQDVLLELDDVSITTPDGALALVQRLQPASRLPLLYILMLDNHHMLVLPNCCPNVPVRTQHP